MAASFRERFCRRFGVPPETFQRAILRRSLYPHVRPWFVLIDRLSPNFFALDRELAAETGRVTERRDFYFALDDFREHPNARKFHRRVLRFRVSSQRLEAVFHETWSAPADLSSDRPSPKRRQLS